MKKQLAIILVLAMLLPVFAGCQSAANAAENPNNNALSAQSNDPNGTPEAPAPKLTREEALAIALGDSKLTETDILELDVDLDRDSGTLHYDVDFEKDGKDYDYDIHADTGEILKKEVPPAPVVSAEPETKITRDKALEIALEDAGLTKDQIQDLDIELDKDDGAVHYDVDFEKDDKDYDYEIDAETGKILKKTVPKNPAATTTSSSSSSSSTSKQISRTKARDIALKHAGLKVSQVRDLEVELDKEGGKTHYDVDFEANGYDYDYEIDATSGKILKSRKEKD